MRHPPPSRVTSSQGPRSLPEPGASFESPSFRSVATAAVEGGAVGPRPQTVGGKSSPPARVCSKTSRMLNSKRSPALSLVVVTSLRQRRASPAANTCVRCATFSRSSFPPLGESLFVVEAEVWDDHLKHGISWEWGGHREAVRAYMDGHQDARGRRGGQAQGTARPGGGAGSATPPSGPRAPPPEIAGTLPAHFPTKKAPSGEGARPVSRCVASVPRQGLEPRTY